MMYLHRQFFFLKNSCRQRVGSGKANSNKNVSIFAYDGTIAVWIFRASTPMTSNYVQNAHTFVRAFY